MPDLFSQKAYEAMRDFGVYVTSDYKDGTWKVTIEMTGHPNILVAGSNLEEATNAAMEQVKSRVAWRLVRMKKEMDRYVSMVNYFSLEDSEDAAAQLQQIKEIDETLESIT